MDIQQDAAHNVPDVILHNGLQDGARQHFDGRKLILTPKKPSTIWRREARPLGLSETVTVTETITNTETVTQNVTETITETVTQTITDVVTETATVTEVVTVTIVEVVTETVTVILP